MRDLYGKNVLITSGGTLEKWDEVRGHTNLAKGTMGCLLAEEALRRGADVIYLHGYFARLPENRGQMKLVPFEGIDDLGAKIKSLLIDEAVDVVIMAAAVSDWVIDEIMDQDGNAVENVGKMSSDNPPLIRFKKAPKIISAIKDWKPDVLLVGFKLEHYTDVQYLIDRANLRMKTWRSEYVVANGVHSLHGESALHYIVSQTGGVRELPNKGETARALFDQIAEHLPTYSRS